MNSVVAADAVVAFEALRQAEMPTITEKKHPFKTTYRSIKSIKMHLDYEVAIGFVKGV